MKGNILRSRLLATRTDNLEATGPSVAGAFGEVGKVLLAVPSIEVVFGSFAGGEAYVEDERCGAWWVLVSCTQRILKLILSQRYFDLPASFFSGSYFWMVAYTLGVRPAISATSSLLFFPQVLSCVIGTS